MKTHELKTWPEHYDPVEADKKRAELRKDDRGFEVGDVLWLREWDRMAFERYVADRTPVPTADAWQALIDEATAASYTGRSCYRRITHILRGGPWLDNGYAMLSMEPVE